MNRISQQRFHTGERFPNTQQSTALLAGSLRDYMRVLLCPVCRSAMVAAEHRSIVCTRGHSFDRAKSGYVNMMLRRVHTAYGMTMMLSRRHMYDIGFFRPVVDYIATLIHQKAGDTQRPLFVADVGCGEGSLLVSAIARQNTQLYGIGIDISKEGIRMASSRTPSLFWCVADLAHLSLQNGCIDILINMLAPAGYTEFTRVLRDDGLLVKVIPGADYLRELRAILYPSGDKQQYSNDRVQHLFNRHFGTVASQRLHFEAAISGDDAQHLLRMTPLSWQTGTTGIALVSDLRSITVDLLVLVGQKKQSCSPSPEQTL